MDCVYLREENPGKKTKDDRQTYECKIHDVCTKIGKSSPYASCEECKDRLTLEADNFSEKFIDQLLITNWTGDKTHHLRHLLAGLPTFLVCGGPSAKELPLEKLNQRGIWSMAVNNMAGYFRPSSFVCADPPKKFHNGIWQDPTIMKFIPTPKMSKKRGRLRRKVGDEFEPLMIDDIHKSACHCPNVWGFGRRAWIKPDESFFIEDHASWGCHNAGVKRTGQPKTVCSMLLAIRILYYLGSRKIFLIGVNWGMDNSIGDEGNYAFNEFRDKNACSSNNSQYEVAGKWLCEMQNNGTFQKFGLEVFNCFQYSGLKAFPYVPFDIAVEDALEDFPQSPFDLQNWYTKN